MKTYYLEQIDLSGIKKTDEITTDDQNRAQQKATKLINDDPNLVSVAIIDKTTGIICLTIER